MDGFRNSAADVGSTAVQIAALSARVEQLTKHLQVHKKDFSTTRGLMAILAQRKQLLAYLQRTDKAAYLKCVQELNIRVQKQVA